MNKFIYGDGESINQIREMTYLMAEGLNSNFRVTRKDSSMSPL